MKITDRVDLTLLLRGLLAVLIVWWHAGGHSATGPFQFLNIPGRVIVWMFFVISGYVIGYGFINRRYGTDRTGLGRFYWNRVLRIFPLFLLVSIAALLVAKVQASPLPAIDIRYFLREWMMLQWSHSYFVGVFWALGIEMQFYVVAPFLFLLNRTGKRIPFLVYAAILGGAAAFHFATQGSWDDRTMAGNLAHFQAGILANYLFSENRPWAPAPAGLVLGSIASVALLLSASALYHARQGVFWVLGPLLVDAGALLLLWVHRGLEANRARGTDLLNRLAGIGLLSYGIYCWSGMIQEHVALLRSKFWPVLAISVPLAYVSYFLFEKPWGRLRRA